MEQFADVLLRTHQLAPMSDAMTRADIRLENQEFSFFPRLIWAGATFLTFAWSLFEFVSSVEAHEAADEAKFLTILIVAGWLTCEACFRSSVSWTIRPNEIRIEKKALVGWLHIEIIRGDEISGMQVLNNPDDGAASFSVEFDLASGISLTTPPIPDVTRVYEISTRIAEHLNLHDVDAAAKPPPRPIQSGGTADFSGIANPEIYLEKPSSRGVGLIVKTTGLLGAGVLCFHLMYGIWITQSISLADVLAISTALIATIVLLKYARFEGHVRWIIRDDEICIERTSNHRTNIDTIGRHSIARMAVQRRDSEDGPWFSIDIWLRSGQRLSSPIIHDESQARSVETEIAQRLKVREEDRLPLRS